MCNFLVEVVSAVAEAECYEFFQKPLYTEKKQPFEETSIAQVVAFSRVLRFWGNVMKGP